MSAQGGGAVMPYLYYADVKAAMAWLTRAFGCVAERFETTPSGGTHGEMRLFGAPLMMGGGRGVQSPAQAGVATAAVFATVPDIMAHHAQAVAAGAAVEGAPADHGYGLTYAAKDLEGQPWYFVQG